MALSALDRLEAAIDLRWERLKVLQWKALLDFKPARECFPPGQTPEPLPRGRWPDTTAEGALADAEQMMLRQLYTVYETVCHRSRRVPDARCDYGPALLPSMFGADWYPPDRQAGEVPARPLESLQPLEQAGPRTPDPHAGLGERALACGHLFERALTTYPATRSILHLHHPDVRSPEDALSLLAGRPLCKLLDEHAERTRRLLGVLADALVRFVDLWNSLVRPSQPHHFAWHGLLLKGRVMLCSSCLETLDAQAYREFVQPLHERIFAHFGGGALQAEGTVDHCIEAIGSTDGLSGVLLTDPARNDMQRVHAATIQRGIVLACPWHEEALRGLDLQAGYVPTDPATFERAPFV
jgi:hypothetical protein